MTKQITVEQSLDRTVTHGEVRLCALYNILVEFVAREVSWKDQYLLFLAETREGPRLRTAIILPDTLKLFYKILLRRRFAALTLLSLP